MTAAAPFPSEGRRPLGEVLVERGIVTNEQLATALEQQRSTGRPLGEIIVGFGFAPGPIVAQALATQHGGLIKTEYGFATGWTTDDTPGPVAAAIPIAASELAERDRVIAELRNWTEKAQAAIASRDEAIEHLRAELAKLQTVPEPAAQAGAHEEALEALRGELAARLEEHAAAIASRDETLAQLRAELADNGGYEEALATLRAELATTLEQHAGEIARFEAAGAELNAAADAREAELAHARQAQATAEHELAAARRTTAELERRLQNASSRAETLARRVAGQDEELAALRAPAPAASEPNRWASAPMHYVLRRGAGTYELVEHDGPPPTVGDTVDGLRVARVAPAGPGFDVPCAYLAD
jgi:predicted RNase H-like nuclease (RuvC/YqgF family)